ncbi:MAG: aminopeptidase P family N-terminal domain-containing protein, partial [Candidatus Puniceispirillaceae bacterium]
MSAQLLSQIRDSLSDAGLDGLYLGRSDKFQGEEVRPCDEYLAWLTGFTGSAGAAVVLSEQAAVFSDGRYILQMANQLDSALFDAVDIIETSPISWLAGKLASGKIGYDGWQVTKSAYDRMVTT